MSEPVYRSNAGQCDKCGNFKTWDFRVPNPKTGKLVPGHIDEHGHKLGDGDCPFYSKFPKKRDEAAALFSADNTPAPKQEKTSVIHYNFKCEYRGITLQAFGEVGTRTEYEHAQAWFLTTIPDEIERSMPDSGGEQ